MKEEYEEVRRDPVFRHVMAIEENGLKFSGRLVHSFLCRELITSKKHEKWFTFARRPMRFSLQEYHAVTGLKVAQDSNSELVKWKADLGFWSQILKKDGKINLKQIKDKHLQDSHNWTRVDRLRLIYLCLIMGVVMGRDEKVNIPHLYMKLAMDFEKLRMYPWGLHSFDFLLTSIEKTRGKLAQTEGYLMEGFLYAFQIWIMEAIPAFGEMCGKKVSESFSGPRCGNWTGCSRCSYEDIKGLETLFPKEGDLFSVILKDINGVVLLSIEYVRKGEKNDERVDRVLDMIKNNHDWSKHEWRVLEPPTSEMEEADEEDVVAEDDTEIEDNTAVAEDVDSSVNVLGKRKKNQDQGAESRKKNLLCKLAAAKNGSVDTEMKRFVEGLIHASFHSFEERFTKQFSDRMEKIETGLTCRMGKMESEISQLRAAITLSQFKVDDRKSKDDNSPQKKQVTNRRTRKT